MFPQVAPKFFADARAGPEEPGQGSGRASRAGARRAGKAAAPDNGKGTVRDARSPTTSKCNGKTHKVTVAPAQ